MTIDLEQVVFHEITQIAEEAGTPVRGPLTRNTEVFASGLDSMGFAVLVAKLEETLGYDPFVSMTQPVYPRTLGEFIDVYAAHQTQG
jgi:hypothetical protein